MERYYHKTGSAFIVALILSFVTLPLLALEFVAGSQQQLIHMERMTGIIKPRYIAEIYCPFNAQIIKQEIPYSQRVKSGTLLYRFHSDELDAQYLQMKSQLLEQIIQFKQLKEWNKGLQMQQAQMNVNKALAMVNQAENKYHRSRILWREGIIAKQECEQDGHHYQQSKEYYENMLQIYDNVKQKADREHARLQWLKVQQLKKQFTAIKKKTKAKKLTSPIDGIWSRPSLYSQQKSWSHQGTDSICQEGDLLGYVFSDTAYQVIIPVDEEQLYTIDDYTTIDVLIPPKQDKIRAKILEQVCLPGQSNKAKKNAEILLEFINQDDALIQHIKPNVQVAVSVSKATSAKGTIVPLSALAMNKGRVVLKKVTNEGISEHEVKILQTDHYFADVSGITKGERILVSDPA